MQLSSPIDLIKKSFSTFFAKGNLSYFLKIYAWLVPFQAFFLYQNYFVESQSKVLNTGNPQDIVMKYPWFLAAVILVNIIFLVVSFWVDAAGIRAIIDVVDGKQKSVKATFQSVRKILWPFSLLLVIFGFITFFGFVLLIIPGILIAVWYGFSKFIFVNEKLGIKGSLIASKKLVSGKFWAVLGRVIVFMFFTLILQMIVEFIPYGVGGVLIQFFGALLVLPYFFLYRELSAQK